MSGFAEAIRLLHDAIFEARENGETLVVGITSALAREGNTTLSLCLARMAAMSGHRVMLLDCNRRRPSTSNLVGKNFARGLVGVLVEKGAWRAHFVPDTDSAAHILPSGPQKMIMRDTFSSPEMHQLISELREAYDLVILDCPPILAVAETTILAQHADLLLMVTRAGETSGASARAAVGMAERAKSDFAGIVLNCLKRSRYNESAYYRGSQHKNANARHL
jgi:capsular exopolysaccharide synthesis family protein